MVEQQSGTELDHTCGLPQRSEGREGLWQKDRDGSFFCAEWDGRKCEWLLSSFACSPMLSVLPCTSARKRRSVALLCVLVMAMHTHLFGNAATMAAVPAAATRRRTRSMAGAAAGVDGGGEGLRSSASSSAAAAAAPAAATPDALESRSSKRMRSRSSLSLDIEDIEDAGEESDGGDEEEEGLDQIAEALFSLDVSDDGSGDERRMRWQPVEEIDDEGEEKEGKEEKKFEREGKRSEKDGKKSREEKKRGEKGGEIPIVPCIGEGTQGEHNMGWFTGIDPGAWKCSKCGEDAAPKCWMCINECGFHLHPGCWKEKSEAKKDNVAEGGWTSELQRVTPIVLESDPPGPAAGLSDDPLTLFSHFFPDEVLLRWVDATNKYASTHFVRRKV